MTYYTEIRGRRGRSQKNEKKNCYLPTTPENAIRQLFLLLPGFL
ncbi:hypothetical protein [Succinimonas sp.]